MAKLKAVIFGIDKVVAQEGPINEKMRDEVGKLIRFVKSRRVQVVILANREWTVTQKEKKRDLQEVLAEEWGDMTWFIANRDGFPHKPTAGAVQHVLEKMGLKSNETIYVGNTEADMRTAVNGNLLFVNATWFNKSTDYGIQFPNPKAVARFVDTFCLRDHLWSYCIVDGDVEFYALAPYSTRRSEYAFYSEDAFRAAKLGVGHPEFWTEYLWSTVYFSGLHMRLNYIAPYPGHTVGYGGKVIEEPMTAFAKCFRIKYLPDLIMRHTEAIKSATNREAVNFENQFNTIKLNPSPLKTECTRFKQSPLTDGKTVLVIDDICTQGYSLETARAYTEQAGAKAVCLAWLKTINRDYETPIDYGSFNPYRPNLFRKIKSNAYPYSGGIVDMMAPKELAAKLKDYDKWTWPGG